MIDTTKTTKEEKKMDIKETNDILTGKKKRKLDVEQERTNDLEEKEKATSDQAKKKNEPIKARRTRQQRKQK